jgi:hypothetical protein
MSTMNSPSMPPTSSDFNMPTEPPAWPKVIGIISIVLGSLGTICGVCGAVMNLSMGAFMEWAAKMQAQGPQGGGAKLPTTPLPAELTPHALSIVSAIGWPIGTIVLIVAGITLLRRAASGRTLHLVYAVISILFTLMGVGGAAIYQGTASKYIAANPTDDWAQFFSQQSGGPSGQLLQALVISCVAIIYPAFCLVWFGAMKRTQRDMTGGFSQDPIV